MSDDTPRGFREPTPMATAIGLARVEERLKAVAQRMDDRHRDQEQRDEDLREAMREAVLTAVSDAIKPLDTRIRELEKLRIQLIAIGTAASVVVPAVWAFVKDILT